MDAIVVYHCGSDFSQEKYRAVRTIRFPPHTLGVGAFWNADGRKWPIYDDEDDRDLFRCLKNATKLILKKALTARLLIPSSKKKPCHETFTGVQSEESIIEKDWMYVVIGSAALLAFLLGVGAIYSLKFQRATANVHGEPLAVSAMR